MPKGVYNHKKASARGRPPMSEDAKNKLRHNMQLAALPPVNVDDPAAIAARIQEYFRLCLENGVSPTVSSMALSFHVHRRVLYQWAYKTPRNDPRALVRDAYEVVNSFTADMLVDGNINPVVGMFLLQNNADYVNQPDAHEDLAPLQLKPPTTREELQAKYLAAAEDVDEDEKKSL